jgi:hypothetical protein
MAITSVHAAHTAARSGLLNCHACSLLVRRPSVFNQVHSQMPPMRRASSS